MKTFAMIATTLMLASLTAHAGKEEREYIKDTVAPAMRAAESAFKSACGCALTIKLNETALKSSDDLYHAKHIADSVKDGAAGYCTDAASKKAVCQMKTLELSKSAEATFTFKGGAGVATTDGQSSTSFEMMTNVLDK